MPERTIPFTKEQLELIIQDHPTPFHIYDEKAIRENARRFIRAFSWVPGGFENHFAVKALPNPYIMEILKEEGMGADCSSLPELVLAHAVGIDHEHIMFSSNDTPAEEYRKAKALGGIINLDDISHIGYLEEHVGLPEMACLRYNPGPMKEGNAIIGNPQEAKYGFTTEQMLEGYRLLAEKGVKRFGMHTMVASNELNWEYFVETAKLLFELAVEVHKDSGITFSFINLGGGIGIPYTPDQQPVDIEKMSAGIQEEYNRIIAPSPIHPVRIVTECGRMVTGPFGYLVSRVIHKKETYKNYIGLDANMANLMRPGMYGAYHHITIPGKEDAPKTSVYDVTGSLCENNDKFAIDRNLPSIEIGDLAVIHETGAHGHSMGFNYNGKLRSAELLLKEDGSVKLIRRAETMSDYFSTLDYPGLATP